MRTFFYFVPDRTSVAAADLPALGLAYAVDGSRGVDARGCDRGPEGLRGVVIAQGGSYDDGQLGYYPERQVWRPIPGANVWVGHYKDALPTPADLARSKQLDGAWLDGDDGNKWLLPVARSYSERMSGEELDIRWSIQLPQKLELAADGKWTFGSVNDRYATLWELAESWCRVRHGLAVLQNEPRASDLARFDFQGQIDGAVLALQANYRLGRVEAALLGILTDALAIEVLDVLIDEPTLVAASKKKAAWELAKSTPSAGSSSSAGEPAAIPITDPPSPT